MELEEEPSPCILLVEDSDVQSKLYASVLKRAGFEVLAACSGAIALAQMRERTPHLILLDLVLPDTDGHELCTTIRKFPEWSRIPIVMLTSQEATDSKVRAFQGGADDYVGKTSDPTELVARVQRLLKRQAIHDELTEQEKLETLQRAANTMAHGINNPLAVLSMGLEVLDGQFPDESPHHQLIEKMQVHLVRIKQLVSKMQRMNRLVQQPPLSDFDIMDVPDETPSAPGLLRRRRGSYRVLVVDDEQDLRLLVRHSLERTGRFVVVEAEDGLAAIEAARIEPPDVIILDVMMPGVDGYTVCQRLKADPLLRDVPVIMLSVNANVRDMVRSFDLGAANYLVKPFDPLRLPEQVFRTLERQGISY